MRVTVNNSARWNTCFIGFSAALFFGFISVTSHAITLAGDHDNSFDADGVVKTAAGSASRGRAVVEQADGKLVIFSESSLVGEFFVSRYLQDGSLDSTFDGDGIAVYSVTGFTLRRGILQSDGKYVLCGVVQNGQRTDFTLIRLMPDGSFDNSFDGDGVVLTAASVGNNQAYDVIQQMDGKLVAFGIGGNGSVYGFATVRYNQDGSLDTTFGTSGKRFDGYGQEVYAGRVLQQADGKLVVIGSSRNGSYYRIVTNRYNSNGTLDKTLSVTVGNLDNFGQALAQQADGKLLLGGYSRDSSHLAGNVLGVTLVRLTTDFSLDSTFGSAGKIRTSLPTSNYINAMSFAQDGKLLLAGVSASTAAVFRYNPDGTVDTGFSGDGIAMEDSGVSGSAQTFTSLLQQSNGRIVAAGYGCYTSCLSSVVLAARYFEDSDTDADGILDGVDTDDDNDTVVDAADNCPLASNPDQLDTDGDAIGNACDPTPNGDSDNDGIDNLSDNCPLNSNANQLDSDADGIGNVCDVTPYGPDIDGDGIADVFDNCVTTANANQIDTDADGLGDVCDATPTPPTGFLDGTFIPGTGPNGEVSSILVQPDGKVLIGGVFTKVNGITRNGIARLNADGSLDSSFNPVVSMSVYAMSLQADGKIFIAGSSGYVVRLNTNGTTDNTFASGYLQSNIYSISQQADGKLIVGGSYYTVSVKRLNATGSLDTSFTLPASGYPGALNGDVNVVLIQPNGKIILAGNFTSLYNTTFNRIARLNADGTLDSGFNPYLGANDIIYSSSLQPDGRIIVAGKFTSMNGHAVNRIARLWWDGSYDDTFNPGLGANDTVYATLVQPDGKIVVAGKFTTMNGVAMNSLARLNQDGSIDTGFNPGSGANSTIFALAVQADGNILIGGGFGGYNGVARNYIARVYSPAPVVVSPLKNDIDADADSDLVFQDSSGVVSTWILENAAVQNINTSVGSITSHALNAICDVDGDLDTDLVFQRPADGDTILWVMQNGIKQSETWLGSLSGYTLSACGDTNKDGNSDLIFADANGNFTVMTLNSNHTVLATTWLGQFSGWSYAALSDVDADGDKDIVMQTASGDIGLITLEGGNKQSASWLGQWSGGWSVVGTGDADNDNDDDLFIATAAGDIGIVKLQAGANVGSDWFGNWPNTSVKAIGDINNDGDADVIFQSTAYDLNVVDVQNAQKAGARWLGQLSGYDIKGTEDVDGDGDDDLVLQDSSGNVAVVVMQAGDKQSLPWLGSNNGSVKVFP